MKDNDNQEVKRVEVYSDDPLHKRFLEDKPKHYEVTEEGNPIVQGFQTKDSYNLEPVEFILKDINLKYYTPSIEEFHVGFEFESTYCMFNDNLTEEWSKVTMSEEEYKWFPSVYKNDAYDVEFRVKYLDQEDIESFGFEWLLDTIVKGELKSKVFLNDNISLYWDIPLRMIYIEENMDIVDCVDSWTKRVDYETLFQGRVKNKSELKRLLNQLHINFKDEDISNDN